MVTPFFFKSIYQGAATTLLCATAPLDKLLNGEYYGNCATSLKALNTALEDVGMDAPDQLREVTEKLLHKLWFE